MVSGFSWWSLGADGRERAERLKSHVRSDVFPAQQFALEELGKSGPSAVRAICEMLDDPAFADEASELAKALVRQEARRREGN